MCFRFIFSGGAGGGAPPESGLSLVSFRACAGLAGGSLQNIYHFFEFAIKNRTLCEESRKSCDMVPETGLEPAHQTAYAPKAYVYTNFTTRACSNYTIACNKKRDPLQVRIPSNKQKARLANERASPNRLKVFSYASRFANTLERP